MFIKKFRKIENICLKIVPVSWILETFDTLSGIRVIHPRTLDAHYKLQAVYQFPVRKSHPCPTTLYNASSEFSNFLSGYRDC